MNREQQPIDLRAELEQKRKNAFSAYKAAAEQFAAFTLTPVEEIILADFASDSPDTTPAKIIPELIYETSYGQLVYGQLAKDAPSHVVKSPFRENPIHLTPIEDGYMGALMRNPTQIISPYGLTMAAARARGMWEDEPEFSPENVRVFMRRLRAKLGDDTHPTLIHTHRWIGYSLASPEQIPGAK